MLSQAVDAGEGLYLKEGGKGMLGDELFDDLHANQALIGLDGIDPALRGKLQLAVSLALVRAPPSNLNLSVVRSDRCHASGAGRRILFSFFAFLLADRRGRGVGRRSVLLLDHADRRRRIVLLLLFDLIKSKTHKNHTLNLDV